MIRDHIFVLAQKIMPKKLLSSMVGKLFKIEHFLVKNFLIFSFSKIYKINIEEAEITDYKKYDSLEKFFSRKLKVKTRPICETTNSIIAPADGRISEIGDVIKKRGIQAKGQTYSISELLDISEAQAKTCEFNKIVTIYLAPNNYHRVHMPIDGELLSVKYVPGNLFSVNDVTRKKLTRLYCRNERTILTFRNESFKFCMVFVGALIVGGIVLSLPMNARNHGNQPVSAYMTPKLNYQGNGSKATKGQEIGYFTFGSTVIFLGSSPLIEWAIGTQSLRPIKMGEQLGLIKTSKT